MQIPPPPIPIPERVHPRGTLGLLNRVVVRRIDEKMPYFDSGYKKSHSWVKNFPRILWINGRLSYADGASTSPSGSTDALGALRRYEGAWLTHWNTYSATYGPMLVKNTVVGNDDYGILIGTDNTAPTPGDYWMGTKIVEGVGAGQLNYGECHIENVDEEATTVDLTIWRSFSNNSGGGITVEEIGIATRHNYINAYSYFLLARDLLNFTVADTDIATVEYRVRIS